jgi:hypothetical protein
MGLLLVDIFFYSLQPSFFGIVSVHIFDGTLVHIVCVGHVLVE